MGIGQLLRPESRAISAASFAIDYDWSGAVSAAGQAVTKDTALAVSTYHVAVRKKARAMMSMPVDAYTGTGDTRNPVPGPRWLKQPNPDQMWSDYVSDLSHAFDTDSNAFIAPLRNSIGRVVELYSVDPTTVQVERHRGRKVYTVGGTEYRGELHHVIAPGAVVDKMRGVPIWRTNAETFGLALAVQNYAATFFGSGGIPPGVIEMTGTPDQAAVEQIGKWWKAARLKKGAHAPGIISGGTWKSTQVDVERTQLTAVRADLGVQISTLCDMPSVFVGLGIQGQGIPYQNIVDAWIWFVREALIPPMRKLEEVHNEMLLPIAQRMTFRTEIFEKADTKGRYEAYKVGIDAGFLTPEDVRQFEDMRPLPAAEVAPDGGSALSVAETVQKVYLGVGPVLTADEARQIVNDAGGKLTGSLPPA